MAQFHQLQIETDSAVCLLFSHYPPSALESISLVTQWFATMDSQSDWSLCRWAIHQLVKLCRNDKKNKADKLPVSVG